MWAGRNGCRRSSGAIPSRRSIEANWISGAASSSPPPRAPEPPSLDRQAAAAVVRGPSGDQHRVAGGSRSTTRYGVCKTVQHGGSRCARAPGRALSGRGVGGTHPCGSSAPRVRGPRTSPEGGATRPHPLPGGPIIAAGALRPSSAGGRPGDSPAARPGSAPQRGRGCLDAAGRVPAAIARVASWEPRGGAQRRAF
jgi:hypothetical protein